MTSPTAFLLLRHRRVRQAPPAPPMHESNQPSPPGPDWLDTTVATLERQWTSAGILRPLPHRPPAA